MPNANSETSGHIWDFAVIGQGLAGTTLAWHLHWLGKTVLILDADEAVTSSKIAAGLVTPITGQRFVKSWRFEEFFDSAQLFYSRIAETTGEKFFQRRRQVRLFCNEKERARYQTRSFSTEDITEPDSLINDEWIANSFGGFQMETSAQLNVPAFLAASRDYFQSINSWIVYDLPLPDGIVVRENNVEFPGLGVLARHCIFCRGATDRFNPWFSNVQFDPTRGEILTVKIPQLDEDRIINRGVWLTPTFSLDIDLEDGVQDKTRLFLAGSTYDWDNLDAGPTGAGRNLIIERLSTLLRIPFEVIRHRAAVRPVVQARPDVGRHPVVGTHPNYPSLGIFNGLGSKGSLQAPQIAGEFALHLVDRVALDPAIDVRYRFPFQQNTKHPATDDIQFPDQSNRPVAQSKTIRQFPNPRRLTERAHDLVRQVLKPGHIAIDATAGNGYDTEFLAKLVTETGRVIAFDIQPMAIKNTKARLTQQAIGNVELLEQCHSTLDIVLSSRKIESIAVAMFNLGYLPRGDKRIVTKPDTTLAALRSSLEHIQPKGLITVMAYPAHDGGTAETNAVFELVQKLDTTRFAVSIIHSPRNGPSLIAIERS